MPLEAGRQIGSLADLLELENAPGLLELTSPSTGVLAWPAIRNDVFRLFLGDQLYATAPIIDYRRRPSSRRAVWGALRSMAHNLRHTARPSDVLVVANGAGLMPRDGALYNRYVDPFACLLGADAWTMEGLHEDRWPRRRRWNQRIGFLGVERFRILTHMRISTGRADRRLATDLVAILAGRAHELGLAMTTNRRAALVSASARRLATYPLRAELAERLLDRTRPRMALVEEGVYGHMAVFNVVARRRGIHVAELQHGLVSPGHDAYNVHATVASDEAYQQTQPHAVLTYGDWWNAQFNAPVDRVAIGNAHRTETLERWQPARMRDRVLVIGDGVETEMYLDFCRELAATPHSDLTVTFRPHPMERDRVATIRHGPFEVDSVPDLYESLARAAVVVGEASTAIYEAVGLVPRVFVWDTDKSRFYLGEHPFARFSTPGELADGLRGSAGEVSASLASAMWAPAWRDRFLAYVKRTESGAETDATGASATSFR